MIKDYNESINKIAKNLEKRLSFMGLTYNDIFEMIMITIWDFGQRSLITEENIYNNVLMGCYKNISEQIFYEDYRNVKNFIKKNAMVTSDNYKNRNCLSNILNFFEKVNLELDEDVLEILLEENKIFEDLLYSFIANSDNANTVLKNMHDSKIKTILQLYIKIKEVKEDEFFKEDNNFVVESTVAWYLKQIANHPILTKEQEIEIFNKYNQATGKEKTELKKQIAVHYLKLGVNIAKKYNNKYLSFEDLINDVNVGLMEAIDVYDVNRGNRFFTLAIWYVYHQMTRYSYNQNRSIKIPADIEEKLSQYLKYQEDFIRDFGREPSGEEIATFLNIRVDQIKFLKSATRYPISLDSPLNEENNNTLYDKISNEDSMCPQTELEKIELRMDVLQSLEKLSILEKQIILIKYGFIDGVSKTLKATAIELYDQGYTDHLITGERVRQLEARALKKLRGIYTEDIQSYLPASRINR